MRKFKRLTALEHNLKSYIDDKLAEYTSDIFRRLEKRYQRDKKFKEKIVEVFHHHNLANADEVAFLKGLLEG